MKIVTDEAVYVQKNDIAFLQTTDIVCPYNVHNELFQGEDAVIIADYNRYDFVKFTRPNDMEFFKSLDWIVDYNALKDLSEEELIELGQGVATKINVMAATFNKMSEEKKAENFDMVEQSNLLRYKMYTLRDIVLFKKNILDMQLPPELNLPTTFENSSEVERPMPKAKRFLKTFFGKKSQ